uniref:Uncharacterized protein n=1 Tax=Chenopodium quinoa TaxID=63459 RepID=A0A803MBX7_CHEQI
MVLNMCRQLVVVAAFVNAYCCISVIIVAGLGEMAILEVGRARCVVCIAVGRYGVMGLVLGWGEGGKDQGVPVPEEDGMGQGWGWSLGGGGADNAEALPIVASPLLLILLGLGIFALAVSSNGGGESIPGRSYKEYHVESYSKWMQNKVHDTYNWEKYYKKVIVKEHVCKKFGKDYRRDSLDKFHKRNLSPYESGCCKPPEECNFNYTSPAVWVKPEIGNYSNVDCNRWDNDPKTLCYDCESCKAALLQDVTYHWFFTGIVLVVILGLPLLIGCVAIITDNISSSKLSVRLLD